MPLLAEAIEQIAASLDKLAEAEHNLAIQQALLDDRLLRVERNRAFPIFNRGVAAGTSLLQRATVARLAEESGDPAEYAKWVAHDLAGVPSVELARAASNTWPHRPTVSVIMAGSQRAERARVSGIAAEKPQDLGEQGLAFWLIRLCFFNNPGRALSVNGA